MQSKKGSRLCGKQTVALFVTQLFQCPRLLQSQTQSRSVQASLIAGHETLLALQQPFQHLMTSHLVE
jgi:hypothetical protein